MSIRTIAVVALLPLLLLTMIDGWPVSRTLTEHECRTFFASHNAEQQLRAMLLCPRTLCPKTRCLQKSPLLHAISKRSAPEPIDISGDALDEELDDFYVFW